VAIATPVAQLVAFDRNIRDGALFAPLKASPSTQLRTGMKRTLLSILLMGTVPSYAGIIAYADGVASGGCSDCTSAGIFDPFGLGPNADLTGREFRIIFEISDAALATIPHVASGGFIRYQVPEDAGYLSAAVVINGGRYDLLSTDVGMVMPYFQYGPDGSFGAHFQDEDVSYLGPDTLFQYDHLSGGGNGTATFMSRQYQFPDGDVDSRITNWNSNFRGEIGAFTILPHTKVSEPGSLVLFGAGLLALLTRRSRRA
jgi:hypothetical protein